jgi:hypothetical protein
LDHEKLLVFAATILAACLTPLAAEEVDAGFTPLFDGKTLDGWKANESQDACTIEDGTTKLKPDGGTIAFQAHDAGSTTYYKNIRIKALK